MSPPYFTTKQQALISFGQASIALVRLLEEGQELDMHDQAFIEHHLGALNLTWKHRHLEK